MANTILHKADTRGKAEHGWLSSRHTFSFANYRDAERVHFGMLRVLNDDDIAGGTGFGTHPHDNMEIITIPLEGDLQHKDSMGNTSVIKNGDVQVMSAGTGITHSEKNYNPDTPVKLLQLWIFPNQRQVTPRYGQITLDQQKMQNNLLQIVSPNADDEGTWIHQDAWLHLGKFEQDFAMPYPLKKSGNGVYVLVIKGSFSIDDTILDERDGLGVWNTDSIVIKALSVDAEILLIEVPMN